MSMATSVDFKDAQTHLDQLIVRASKGEEIVIVKDGKPCARLMPARNESTNHERALRIPGRLEGQGFWMAPDFDETSEEIIKLFEGEDDLL